MAYARHDRLGDLDSLPKLPAWVTSGRAETFETVAFRSGAALTVLDGLISDPAHGVPVKLLANRLALTAATATSKLEGRLAREGDLRDAYHLAAPGAARGPDGDLLSFWRQAVKRRAGGRSGRASLVGPDFAADAAAWIETGCAQTRTQGPLAGCVWVLRRVLEADDRAERIACLLSDMVLADGLTWPSVLPVTAQSLTKSGLRALVADGQRAELVIQQAILDAIENTIRLARDLAHAAFAIRAVAPKLRAKGAEAAVALFLTEDAVAPSTMLSPMIQGSKVPMTGRAARRFCDRLVELGVARELTGRPTFRLYGIAP